MLCRLNWTKLVISSAAPASSVTDSATCALTKILRNERQRAATLVPQNFSKRTSRTVCHAACRCSAAYHQLCPVEPAEHWVSPRKYVDRLSDITASAISRLRQTAA